MNLNQLAEQDLQTTLEDRNNGFAAEVTIVNPNNVSAMISGQVVDTHALLDPGLNQLVSQRQLSVTFRISSLTAVGLEMPLGVLTPTAIPWTARIDGQTYKIAKVMPDASLGIVVCQLEDYVP